MPPLIRSAGQDDSTAHLLAQHPQYCLLTFSRPSLVADLSPQSQQLAQELAQKLPAAALAGLIASMSVATPAFAVDYAPAPEANTVVAEQQQAPSSFNFQGATQVGPGLRTVLACFRVAETLRHLPVMRVNSQNCF